MSGIDPNWRDILIPQLKSGRYLVYCEAELDRDYRLKQWYAASYHTNGDKKGWFLLEHPSHWLNDPRGSVDKHRCFKDPAEIIAIKPLPANPEVKS